MRFWRFAILTSAILRSGTFGSLSGRCWGRYATRIDMNAKGYSGEAQTITPHNITWLVRRETIDISPQGRLGSGAKSMSHEIPFAGQVKGPVDLGAFAHQRL